MVEFLPLSEIEPQAVGHLLDAAFGADRFGRTAYRIRLGMDAVPCLSFAAVEDGALVGTIQCWPVALTDPAGRAETVSGACPGRIVDALRGAQGFGYDPLFVPDGFAQTFAEMGSEQKNRLSHRGRALALAQQKWGALIAANAAGFLC